MKVADGGVESDGLDGRGRVVDEECIKEGEQGVDVVDGRSSVSIGESEVFFLRGDEMIEGAKVGAGGVAFESANGVKGKRGGGHARLAAESLEQCREVTRGLCEILETIVVGSVACASQEDGAAVGDFGDDDGAGEFGGRVVVVGAAVLFAAQEDVAADGSFDARPESTAFAEKGDGDLALATEAHQGWADGDLAETDDGAEGVDGNAEFCLLLDADEQRLVLAREVGALGSDVESVEKAFHGLGFRG